MPGFSFPSVGPLGLSSPPSRPSIFGHRYYDPLRLPLLHPGALRFRSILGTLRLSPFVCVSQRLTAWVEMNPDCAWPLLYSGLPVPVLSPQGDGGSLECPNYPCMYMPCSGTPVVSCQLAITFSGLMLSGSARPSAFPSYRQVILTNHNYEIFGAQSHGLHTRYTRLQTHLYRICMRVYYRIGG